jgi:uncharacterized protein (TIGR02145 family)
VKECYPPTYTPDITSPDYSSGSFHVKSLKEITFHAKSIDPKRDKGPVTYTWNISAPGKSFTPATQSGTSSSFTSKAPLYENGTDYTLTLQVAADGYCSSEAPTITRNVVIDPAGSLTGTVTIREAVAATKDPNNPVVWIARRSTTLHANYVKGDGEVFNELDLRYRWYWTDDKNKDHDFPEGSIIDEENGVITFTPSESVSNGQIRVEVSDLNGKSDKGRSYPYTVQNCGYDNLPGLHININYPCEFKKGHSTAYVVDSIIKIEIYPVVNIGTKWWFTENLRKDNNAVFPNDGVYGAYYPGVESVIMDLSKTDGAYCPKGWRIPKKEEDWEQLHEAIDPSMTPSTIFVKLATTETASSPSPGSTAWNNSTVTPSGLDSEGFRVVPAGFYYNGVVRDYGEKAEFLIFENKTTGQGYGAQNGPGTGRAYSATISSDRHYTVRCVND